MKEENTVKRTKHLDFMFIYQKKTETKTLKMIDVSS